MQLAFCRGIDSVADFLATRCGGCNVELGGKSTFFYHVAEKIFRHGGTADVAVADEKYMYHEYQTPF